MLVKRFFLIVVSLLLLGSLPSCIMDELTTLDSATSLALRTYMGTPSKMSETGFENGDEIGVYVMDYLTGTTAPTLGESGYFATNRAFLKYNGMSYWTVTDGADVTWSNKDRCFTLFAYYPYSDYVNSVLSYSFTVKSSQQTADNYYRSDFLWSKKSDVVPQTDPVDLTFRHLMSKVCITLIPGQGFADNEFSQATKSMQLTQVARRTTVNLTTGALGSVSDFGAVVPLQSGYVYTAILPPQTVDASNVLIALTVGNKQYTFSTDRTFEGGKQYNYQLIVPKEDGGALYTMSLNSITDWEDGGGVQTETAPGESLSRQGTANSYMVSTAGRYSFYAGHVGNGDKGIMASQKFHAASAAISPATVRVLWESDQTQTTVAAGTLLEEVWLNPLTKYVSFTYTGVAGNALIGVEDASGTLLWSWHLWCTDTPQSHYYVNHAGRVFPLMDRNLGAMSQEADTGTLSYGLYYQWGRKDPFLVAEAPQTVVTANRTRGNVAYSIANPQTFITYAASSDGDWVYGSGSGVANRNNALWGNPLGYTTGYQAVKTIYDPCPPGYMMPPSDAWTGFTQTGVLAAAGQMNAEGSFDAGWFLRYNTQATAWFPAAGYRQAANVWQEGSRGVYWSSAPVSATLVKPMAFSLTADTLDVASTQNTFLRAYGAQVRCMASVEEQYPYSEELLTLSSDRLDLTGVQGTGSVVVHTSSDAWTAYVAEGADWITLTTAQGVNAGTVVYAVTENTTAAVREGAIIVQTNGQLREVRIAQAVPDFSTTRKVLKAIYEAAGGDQWTCQTNWGSDQPLDTWYGLTVNAQDQVTAISLGNNALSGYLHDCVGRLTHLTSLDVSQNSLTGTLPTLTTLTQLTHLAVNNNGFSGALPSDLGQLTTLTRVSMQQNAFSGSVPSGYSALTLLDTLNLASNQLTGAVPEIYGNMTTLDAFYLEGNQLEGALPVSLTQLMSRGTDVRLYYNLLYGSVPAALYTHSYWDRYMFRLIRQRNAVNLVPPDAYKTVPDFSLTNDQSQTITSADYFAQANYTIIWFWHALSTTSPLMATMLSTVLSDNANNGVQMLAIGDSYEQYYSASLAFVNDYAWLNTTHLSEFGYARSWLALSHDNNELCYAPYIVVDGNGMLVYDAYDDGVNALPLFFMEKFPMYESTDYSQDGTYTTLYTHTKGAGVPVVIMGDGFSDKAFDQTTGNYDTTMETAMNHLFSVEPLKSYKPYFDVYQVNVVSANEEYKTGSSTALGIEFGAGTSISYDDEHETIIFDYANTVPGLPEVLPLVLVVINSPRWAGTCASYSDGSAVAMCPLHDNDTDFRGVVIHEAGGHGIGNLLDEYIYWQETITTDYIDQFNDARNTYNMGYNLTLNVNDVPWDHFFDLDGYDYVSPSLYEGGYFFAYGIWRSEEISCMDDNRAYFSAPSRELMVQHIMSFAGLPYSLTDFLANDVYEPVITGSTKGIVPYRLREPYAPPQLKTRHKSL